MEEIWHPTTLNDIQPFNFQYIIGLCLNSALLHDS